jgi:hypothetical protein
MERGSGSTAAERSEQVETRKDGEYHKIKY